MVGAHLCLHGLESAVSCRHSSVMWVVSNTSPTYCCYLPGIWAGTKLYCLVTEALVCEQLAYSCYLFQNLQASSQDRPKLFVPVFTQRVEQPKPCPVSLTQWLHSNWFWSIFILFYRLNALPAAQTDCLITYTVIVITFKQLSIVQL